MQECKAISVRTLRFNEQGFEFPDHGGISRMSVELGNYLLDQACLTKPLDWRSIFDEYSSVELEVGSGKGLFLAAAAAARPHSAFLGMERSPKWATHSALRLSKAELRNAKIVCTEAVAFMEEFVQTSSIQAVHVYFPDPWPKGKHEKRRIWGERFVEEILRVLIPGGRIFLSTDIKGYFISTQRLLSSISSLQQVHISGDWPVTGYARKYLAHGRPVFSTVFQKEATPGISHGGQAHVTQDW